MTLKFYVTSISSMSNENNIHSRTDFEIPLLPFFLDSSWCTRIGNRNAYANDLESTLAYKSWHTMNHTTECDKKKVSPFSFIFVESNAYHLYNCVEWLSHNQMHLLCWKSVKYLHSVDSIAGGIKIPLHEKSTNSMINMLKDSVQQRVR